MLYAGAPTIRESFPGVFETVPVGYFHTRGSQGGAAARDRRRLRRHPDMWPAMQPVMQQPMQPMQQPMQPMGMMQMQPMGMMPMQQPMHPMQPMWMPSNQPMPSNMMAMQQPMAPQPMTGMNAMPPPPPGMPPADDASKKQKDDSWEANKKWAKPWAKKADSWEANKKWAKAGKPTAEDEAMSGKWWEAERNARMILMLKLVTIHNDDMAKHKLMWCHGCHAREYVGLDLCLTPGCRVPFGVELMTEALKQESSLKQWL